MKTAAQRIAAAMIACCLSVLGFCQSATIQDAAKNPAVHETLRQKIERDQQEVRAYKVGHVVVGRIQLEGTDDPEFIRSQMMIFEEGFFSDAVRDLNRPIAFRMLGYRPVDAVIPPGASPDDSGAIDLGTIRMEKCAPSEFRKAVGMISVPNGADPSSVQVLLHLSGGRANTPHNGTEPVRKHATPIQAQVDKSGGMSAAGLTEGEYYVTFKGDDFVGQAKSYQVTSDKDLDLGTIRLEKPLVLRVEYIVAENPATTFDPDAMKEATFPAGTKWKSGPMNEWDLEFVQTAATVTFNYSYGPCTLADLGEGKLADFVNTDFSTAKLDPRQVPFRSGHVYLLDHQRSLKHVVLFRVTIQEPTVSAGKTAGNKVDPKPNSVSLPGNQDLDDKVLRALLEARRDTLKLRFAVAQVRLESQEFHDPVSIGRVVEFEQALLSAELELATSKEERIAILEAALKSTMRFEAILEVRSELSESPLSTRAARIQIEIDLHRARKVP